MSFFFLCFCKALKCKCEEGFSFDISLENPTAENSQTVKEKIHQENRMWLLMLTFLAPIVCMGTHAGFVIMAWSSDPDNASTMTVIFILSFFYYFLAFRQSYIILVSCPKIRNIEDENESQQCCKCYSVEELSTELRKHHEYLYKFNFTALVFEIPIAIVLVAFQAVALLTFIFLPGMSGNSIPTSVLNILHIMFLVGSGLIAYKLLTFHTPKEEEIIENFVSTYDPDNSSKNLAGKTGEILGLALKRLVNATASRS